MVMAERNERGRKRSSFGCFRCFGRACAGSPTNPCVGWDPSERKVGGKRMTGKRIRSKTPRLAWL